MINFDKLLGKIKENRLTQQEYCKLCGITAHTLINYRQKPGNVRVEFIEKSKQILNLTRDELNDIFFAQ